MVHMAGTEEELMRAVRPSLWDWETHKYADEQAAVFQLYTVHVLITADIVLNR